MKLFIPILLIIAVFTKCKGSCDLDKKTVQLFWNKKHFISKTFSLKGFLLYHEIKKELVSLLSLNRPKINCDVEDICNTKLSKVEKRNADCDPYCVGSPEPTSFEFDYDYESEFKTEFDYDILHDLELEDYSYCELYIEIDSILFSYEFDYDYDLEFDYDSEFLKENLSFCELYFKFEHKTEFVFLVDHLELWLFSNRNFTIHSNQFIKESGSSFFSRR